MTSVPPGSGGLEATGRPVAGPAGRFAGVLVLLAVLVVAGCGDLLYEDAAPVQPALLTLEYTPQLQGVDGADGTAAAFGAVDQVHVQVTSGAGGGQTLVDETFAASAQGGEIRVQVEVELDDGGETLEVRASLRGGGSDLFVGTSSVSVEPGATTQADVALSPVAADLRVEPEAPA